MCIILFFVAQSMSGTNTSMHLSANTEDNHSFIFQVQGQLNVDINSKLKTTLYSCCCLFTLVHFMFMCSSWISKFGLLVLSSGENRDVFQAVVFSVTSVKVAV